MPAKRRRIFQRLLGVAVLTAKRRVCLQCSRYSSSLAWIRSPEGIDEQSRIVRAGQESVIR
jgi:hypothetical protein